MRRLLNTLHAYSREISDLQGSERAAFHAMHLMLKFADHFRPSLGRQLHRIFNDSYRRSGKLVATKLMRKEKKAARMAVSLRALQSSADELTKRAAAIEAQLRDDFPPRRRDGSAVIKLKAENATLRAELIKLKLKKIK